jgi:hypothetical protein
VTCPGKLATRLLLLLAVQKAMPSVPLLKGFGWVEIMTVVSLDLIDPDPVGP